MLKELEIQNFDNKTLQLNKGNFERARRKVLHQRPDDFMSQRLLQNVRRPVRFRQMRDVHEANIR